jgi:hypothetical protein
VIVFWLFWLVWFCAMAFGAFAANNEPPEVRYFWISVLVLLGILNFAIGGRSEVKSEFEVMTFDRTRDERDLWAEFKSNHEHCSHTGCFPNRCGFAVARESSLPIVRGWANALSGESSAFYWLLKHCKEPSDGAKVVLFQDVTSEQFHWMIGARCATRK